MTPGLTFGEKSHLLRATPNVSHVVLCLGSCRLPRERRHGACTSVLKGGFSSSVCPRGARRSCTKRNSDIRSRRRTRSEPTARVSSGPAGKKGRTPRSLYARIVAGRTVQLDAARALLNSLVVRRSSRPRAKTCRGVFTDKQRLTAESRQRRNSPIGRQAGPL